MCLSVSVGIVSVIRYWFNFGVLESGSIVGLSNFIIIGIGKTPLLNLKNCLKIFQHSVECWKEMASR